MEAWGVLIYKRNFDLPGPAPGLGVHRPPTLTQPHLLPPDSTCEGRGLQIDSAGPAPAPSLGRNCVVAPTPCDFGRKCDLAAATSLHGNAGNVL